MVYEWKPTNVRFYLKDKVVARNLEDPEKHPDSLRVVNPGFMLGFTNTLSSERMSQRKYQFDNEGLVLKPEDPIYQLEAAKFAEEQTFADYSWKSNGKSIRRVDPTRFETAEAFKFQPNHPYEGPIDGVLQYGTVSYEGDCGPQPAFEAFFYRGRLVAGWNYNLTTKNLGKRTLDNSRDLAEVLNLSGRHPHPSEQQVKEYLLQSNLERTLLNRFEEFLTL